MREHNTGQDGPAFRCRVAGLGRKPTRSNWQIVVAYLAVMMLSDYCTEINLSRGGTIVIKGQGWVLVGLLLGPLILHLTKVRPDVTVGRDELIIRDRRSEATDHVTYSEMRSVSLRGGDVVLSPKSGIGSIRLTPARLHREDLLDAIRDAMETAQQSRAEDQPDTAD